MADKRVALAAVAGAHGVKGEVRLKLFTDSAAGLASHRRVFIGDAEHRLTDVREGGKTAVARIQGVSDRSAAEALRGNADLLGLPCVDGDGEPVGTVAGIENFGAGDLLEVELPDGKRSLIPFRDGVADLEDGRIILDRDFLA
jgi:16S rRNA processing protein RimM